MTHTELEGQPERVAEPFSLSGRAALVTGAARGIGFATALRMHEAGAAVALNDIDGPALAEALERLPQGGAPIIAIEGDVSDLSTHRPMVARVVEELGSLDVLVNNAGTFQPTPLDALDPDVIDDLYALNVKGVLFLCAAAVEKMPTGGSIINLSSLGGIRPPFPGLAAYHATKGAVDSLTRDMALDWGPRGIRVNGVGPGGILTEGRGQVTEHPMFAPAVLDGIMERATSRPLRRMGYADDIATTIVFLASPAARFITGQQLLVDGGYYFA